MIGFEPERIARRLLLLVLWLLCAPVAHAQTSKTEWVAIPVDSAASGSTTKALCTAAVKKLYGASLTCVERVTTKFSVLKNGMRFPGEVRLASILYYLAVRPENNRSYEVSKMESKQSYTKYRFYAVRTSEEVRQILTSKPRPR